MDKAAAEVMAAVGTGGPEQQKRAALQAAHRVAPRLHGEIVMAILDGRHAARTLAREAFARETGRNITALSDAHAEDTAAAHAAADSLVAAFRQAISAAAIQHADNARSRNLASR